MNNFYKINNRYNIQNPWISVPSQDRSKSTTRINNLSPKIAAFVNKIENHHSVESSSSSSLTYHEKINQILTNWQQLQKEKKIYQQKQVVTEKEQNEFDRIIEEDLENQLKELEREEEKQYQLIEQVIGEQLEQEYQNNSTDYVEQDQLKQLQQLEELETMIEDEEEEEEEEEEEKQNKIQFKKNKTWKRHEQHYHLEQFKKYQQEQQSNNKQLDKINKFCHPKQQNLMNLDLWKQKHDMYLKQIMSKVNQMKTNKIIHLLEICCRTKKYYAQRSKQHKQK